MIRMEKIARDHKQAEMIARYLSREFCPDDENGKLVRVEGNSRCYNCKHTGNCINATINFLLEEVCE